MSRSLGSTRSNIGTNSTVSRACPSTVVARPLAQARLEVPVQVNEKAGVQDRSSGI